MKVVAIVQARMGSTRLPGKVLREIEGRPMIAHVLERVGRIDGVDEVCVATSESPLDDPLAAWVEQSGGSGVFRGSEHDVLGRFAGAARSAQADAVVRVTADCPLLCPSVSQRVVRELLAHAARCDYASNTLSRTYPRGLDTEVFSANALLEADRLATDAWDREHVTPYLYRQPGRFAVREVKDSSDNSHHRWTVDTEEDLELVRRIYGALWRTGEPPFEYAAILACVAAHPEWTEINQHVQQKHR
jgi:spore coat polysaccharide biosynthesis protein SpsF